jgi:DNA-binding FadR family transcriptional regulator
MIQFCIVMTPESDPHRNIRKSLTAHASISELRDLVLDTLGQEICGNTLAPGSLFSTDSIGIRFHVSRPVVREALRALEALGMISPKRRVGITVLPISYWNVFDIRVIRWRLEGSSRVAQLRSLTELRMAIEPSAARMAAVRASPYQASELVQLASELIRSGKEGKIDEFLLLDIQFHSMVLEMTGNEMFTQHHHLIAEVLLGRTQYNLMPKFPSPEGPQLHLELAVAIQAGNEEKASLATLAIMDRTMSEMRLIWDQPSLDSVGMEGVNTRKKPNLD